MIRFKDIQGNCQTFVRANVSLIYYTPQDQEGISQVSVTTTNNNVYSFAVEWNDADAIKES